MTDEDKNKPDQEPQENAAVGGDESVENLLDRVDDLLAGLSDDGAEKSGEAGDATDEAAATPGEGSDFLSSFSDSCDSSTEDGADTAEAGSDVETVSNEAEQVVDAVESTDDSVEEVADEGVAEEAEQTEDAIAEDGEDGEGSDGDASSSDDAAAGAAAAATSTAAADRSAKGKKGRSKNKRKSEKRAEASTTAKDRASDALVSSSGEGVPEEDDDGLTPQQRRARRDEFEAERQQAEARATLEKYGKMAAMIAAGVLAVTLVFGLIKKSTTDKSTDSYRAFTDAETPEQLLEMVNAYSDAKAAPLALIQAAQDRFNADQAPAALELYDRFLAEYPAHDYAPAAEYGKLFCLEATGEVEKALEGWEAFLAAHEDYFLAPSAVLAQARCMEHLDKLEEAKTIYEDFIAKNAGSDWAAQAQQALDRISN